MEWESLLTAYAEYGYWGVNLFNTWIKWPDLNNVLDQENKMKGTDSVLLLIFDSYIPLKNIIVEYFREIEYESLSRRVKLYTWEISICYGKLRCYELLRNRKLDTYCSKYICPKCNRDPKATAFLANSFHNDATMYSSCQLCIKRTKCKWEFCLVGGSKCSCKSFMYTWNIKKVGELQWMDTNKILGELVGY